MNIFKYFPNLLLGMKILFHIFKVFICNTICQQMNITSKVARMLLITKLHRLIAKVRSRSDSSKNSLL